MSCFHIEKRNKLIRETHEFDREKMKKNMFNVERLEYLEKV